MSNFVIKTYSIVELSFKYGVCVRTFKKEIIKANIDIELNKYKKIFFPFEVIKIIEKLGVPE
ncbi:MAG TPA: hypothetical protein PKK18_04115 [Chitinophagales bacterium]|nr:hypothetical protein [Chitinophagales bacterium]HMX59771.1 hypothetical protein [Chitinophagales bacterium]HMY22579.1 hypothetical protein [Chitinophagales bacterium]HMZ33427.1 hypothetical protein [Chitinophagales bacterium]HNA38724.1 hypothetical protein [Chitinophagales bacterium]